MKQYLAIVSNEKTTQKEENFFCDNIDMKSIPEGLKESYEINLFVRNSKIERSSHSINLNNVIVSKGIFSYVKNIIKTKNLFDKYLIISLSPYTFVIILLLFILRKKVYLYLRSDGYEEYKCYSKYLGPIIYHIMFTLSSFGAKLIACRSHILKGKNGHVVSPSQLNEKWLTNRKPANLEKIKLLYVGRIKVEKGIYSLIKILNEMELDYKISIINSEKFHDKKLENKNIEIINFQNKNDSIINIYDDHNIFILPSFTEGHPQVLDEALSRLRPVVIFPEISHVTRNRDGVFVSERNSKSLSKKIKYIIQEYENIHKKMSLNRLPTKKLFLKELKEIIK